jgi:hypothetical protein
MLLLRLIRYRVIVTLLFLILFANYKSQTFFFSKATGNLNTLSTWGLNTDGSGTAPTNFTTANRVFIITNTAAATIGAAWTVSGAGSRVQVGNGITGVVFTIPATFAFTGTVDVTNTGSLTIQNATNPTIGSLAAGSTVNYGSAGNQTIVNANYFNLTLSGSGRKGFANTTSSSITNLVNISTGVTFRLHTVNTLTATLSGSITGAGTILGNANSNLIINGTGNFGTLTFSTTLSLFRFIINRTASGNVNLGSNLTVSNAFVHSNGTIGLNGRLLTLNNAITFPATIANGSFIGSTTSSITIGASATSITNSLLMDQTNSSTRSLNRLGISRVGQSLILGNDLIVVSNFVQTNGIINLNGRSLSISGVITFPAAIANGAFTGSGSSSLTIGGAGVVTNSLKMDQTNATNRTLNSLTINHTGGTTALGNNLICASQFIHTNGAITIGATLLTLNGSITFPVAASSGSFTGSATSSISIGGSGAISNSLFMSQVNAAARTLNNITFDRVSQILSLGNPLIINTFNHTNGIINLNGTLLTLNNAITFPATISNGSFIGSLSSSLTIGGTGVITNTLKMDQSNISHISLFDLTLNRTGQTLTLGNALEIRNSILPTLGNIVTGGFVKLKSDATRSAMVGTVGGSISGNISVETFAPGGFTGWTNLGPSGVTGLTVANWEGQIAMSCIGCPNDEFSAGGFFVSIQSYNEAGVGAAAYVPLSYSSSLTRGNGYWVYMGNGTSTTTALTYSVSGPIVTGAVLIPVTVSANTGFNLVSNPYPAPIDWDLITVDAANANISGSIYFYNPDLGVTISYAAGVSSPSGYISNGIIPMGQGFYVQANSGTNLTFRETHKSIQNTSANPLLKTQKSSNIGDVFRLSVVGANLDYDETVIRIHSDATTSYDKALDAYKLFQTPGYLGTVSVYSKYTTISSRMGSDDYSINSLPSSQGTPISIPILVKVMATGTFVISPIDLQNFPSNSCLTLKDKLLNINHDLRTGSYTCVINDTTSTPRFELTICDITTSINQLTETINQVLISQDANSTIFVSTKFEKNTKSIISACNVLGQKIMSDREIEGTENVVTLNLKNTSNQLVIINVVNDKGFTRKKVYVN